MAELTPLELAVGYTRAVSAAIDYVLDGGRTGRFNLLSPEVHPGERASVGAKLEYEAQREFSWPKAKPLDILVAGVPVDLKVTVGNNWAIPSEAHCKLCICTQIQLRNNRHRSWLVRAHTSWLYRGKGNKDGKRGLAVHARDHWSVPLYDWAPLPVNPLSFLSEQQLAKVFEDGVGQRKRLIEMFSYLPGRVIPRSVIETVCAGHDDPIRRVRQTRPALLERGLLLLCGTPLDERAQAADRGHLLSPGDWVAVPLLPAAPSPYRPEASDMTLPLWGDDDEY
ncbi:NaeI family type II restriction endonuclease [Kitasatospora sp. McL0602]|uniref:NaeI family type II restriction endonuclease n=1 Tax=Kitasatospora sp. McL0602 TaxID=3439530 RepID=UPI003F88C947